MKTLEAWAAAKPGSATARIAQANAHAALAWRARGSGYANTVTQEGWATYHEQMALAANALVEAAKREDRCPYWYLVMQTVALAQQWDRGEVRALFDEAAAFEPDFYYYYQNYANYLEPKWFGEEGETEAFAEQAWLHVGGDQGDIIYFQIAGNRICWCDPDGGRVAQMSWPRIQSGYEATNRLYGASSYTNNRFAFLAFQFHDRAATRAAIRTIENSPDTKVWGPDLFQKAKVWSESGDSTSASSDTY